MVAEVRTEGQDEVFLSSHILPEVEHTCDRVAIIREGRLVKIDHVSSLKEIPPARCRDQLSWSGLDSIVQTCRGRDQRGAGSRSAHSPIEHPGDIDGDHSPREPARRDNIATREPTLEEVFLRFYEPEQAPSTLAGSEV